jgi:hypothetical protein
VWLQAVLVEMVKERIVSSAVLLGMHACVHAFKSSHARYCLFSHQMPACVRQLPRSCLFGGIVLYTYCTICTACQAQQGRCSVGHFDSSVRLSDCWPAHPGPQGPVTLCCVLFPAVLQHFCFQAAVCAPGVQLLG